MTKPLPDFSQTVDSIDIPVQKPTAPSPGPYTADERAIYCAEGRLIARAIVSNKRSDANARLLAASWDLLVLVQAYAAELLSGGHEPKADDACGGCDWLWSLNEVIAKATQS